MITRRTLLKGIAAGATVSVAAAAYTGKNTEPGPNVLESADFNWVRHNACPMTAGCGVEHQGFGLARAKPEGGTYYVDPMDDPDYRGPMGQGGKYAQCREGIETMARIHGAGHQS